MIVYFRRSKAHFFLVIAADCSRELFVLTLTSQMNLQIPSNNTLINNGSLNPSIGIIGAGYVGLVAGACFSSLGFNIRVVEIDSSKLNTLRNGQTPFFEPGLDTHLKDGLQKKRLHFHSSTQEMFRSGDVSIVFIAVGTPSHADGSCNLDYVLQAAKDVVQAANNDMVLVLKSTVPVGTAKRIKEIIGTIPSKHRIAVVNNPEFLKEGAAVSDFMRPERIVIGGTEQWALDRVKALYESLVINGHPLYVTDHESAELGKLAANLLLASRVSVINQISRLATAVGADIKHIESILKSDSRIGSKYLYAGLGYGGSCFPKDVKNFIFECQKLGVESSVAEAIDNFNTTQKLIFIDHIVKSFPNPRNTCLTMLGLAFKAETDDIREAPSLSITQALCAKGYSLKVYDPQAMQTYGRWVRENNLSGVEICNNAEQALTETQALLLLTEWQEFHRFTPERLKAVFTGRTIYDGKNLYKPEALRAAGFEYVGVGRKY